MAVASSGGRIEKAKLPVNARGFRPSIRTEISMVAAVPGSGKCQK
jgi:hypothetical protein